MKLTIDNKINIIKELKKHNTGMSTYECGMHNGLETALAVLEDREFAFRKRIKK